MGLWKLVWSYFLVPLYFSCSGQGCSAVRLFCSVNVLWTWTFPWLSTGTGLSRNRLRLHFLGELCTKAEPATDNKHKLLLWPFICQKTILRLPSQFYKSNYLDTDIFLPLHCIAATSVISLLAWGVLYESNYCRFIGLLCVFQCVMCWGFCFVWAKSCQESVR